MECQRPLFVGRSLLMHPWRYSFAHTHALTHQHTPIIFPFPFEHRKITRICFCAHRMRPNEILFFWIKWWRCHCVPRSTIHASRCVQCTQYICCVLPWMRIAQYAAAAVRSHLMLSPINLQPLDSPFVNKWSCVHAAQPNDRYMWPDHVSIIPFCTWAKIKGGEFMTECPNV